MSYGGLKDGRLLICRNHRGYPQWHDLLNEADAAIKAMGAAKMLDALKMVMQHGRIDYSEERMNLVASIIAQVEKRKDA